MAQTKYMEEVDSFRKELVHSAMNYEKDPPLSPSDTVHLSYFPIQKEWMVTAQFHKLEKDTFIKIPTSAGTEKIFKVLGIASFEIGKHSDSLIVYQPFRSGLKDYLFIPFKDQTSGLSTYGGGRYIEGPLHLISEDQKNIILDFNKAYNPWCAYSEGYFCPLPPIENNLSIRISAGEKKFQEHESN